MADHIPDLDGGSVVVSPYRSSFLATSAEPPDAFGAVGADFVFQPVLSGAAVCDISAESVLSLLVQAEYLPVTEGAAASVTSGADISSTAESETTESDAVVLAVGATSHQIISLVAEAAVPAHLLAEPASEYVIEIYRSESEVIYGRFAAAADYGKGWQYEYTIEGATFASLNSGTVVQVLIDPSSSSVILEGDVAAAISAAASVLTNAVQTIIPPITGADFLFLYGSDILLHVRSYNYGRTLEAKPTIYATLETVPADWPAADGAYTQPVDDGAWDEYPVDGAYTRIGYEKEMKPRRRYSTRTWESVPTEHNTTESKPAYAGTKEDVPH